MKVGVEDSSTKTKPSYLALRPQTIEKTFTDSVMDLKEVIALDGIVTSFQNNWDSALAATTHTAPCQINPA